MQLFIFARTNKNPPALCWIPLVSWQLQNRSCRRQVWYTIDDIFFFHRRKLCKIFAFKYFIWFLMCTVGPRKQLYRYQSSHLYFFFFFCKSNSSDLLLSSVRENSHKFLKSVKIQSWVLTLVCCALAFSVKKAVHFPSGYTKEIWYTAGLSTRIWLALQPILTFPCWANVRMDNI